MSRDMLLTAAHALLFALLAAAGTTHATSTTSLTGSTEIEGIIDHIDTNVQYEITCPSGSFLGAHDFDFRLYTNDSVTFTNVATGATLSTWRPGSPSWVNSGSLYYNRKFLLPSTSSKVRVTFAQTGTGGSSSHSFVLRYMCYTETCPAHMLKQKVYNLPHKSGFEMVMEPVVGMTGCDFTFQCSTSSDRPWLNYRTSSSGLYNLVELNVTGSSPSSSTTTSFSTTPQKVQLPQATGGYTVSFQGPMDYSTLSGAGYIISAWAGCQPAAETECTVAMYRNGATLNDGYGLIATDPDGASTTSISYVRNAFDCTYKITCPSAAPGLSFYGASSTGSSSGKFEVTSSPTTAGIYRWTSSSLGVYKSSTTTLWYKMAWTGSTIYGAYVTYSCETASCEVSKESGLSGKTVSLSSTAKQGNTIIPMTIDSQRFNSDDDGATSTYRVSSGENGDICSYSVTCPNGYYVVMNVSGRFVSSSSYGKDRILATGGDGKKWDFSVTNGYSHIYQASQITTSKTLSWTQSAHYYGSRNYGYSVDVGCTTFVAGTCPAVYKASSTFSSLTAGKVAKFDSWVLSSSYPKIPTGYKCEFPMTCPSGQNIKINPGTGVSQQPNAPTNPNAPTFKTSTGTSIWVDWRYASFDLGTNRATMTWETKVWNVTHPTYSRGFNLGATCVDASQNAKCGASPEKALDGTTVSLSSTTLQTNTAIPMTDGSQQFDSDTDGPNGGRLVLSESPNTCHFAVSCPSGYYVMLNVSGRFVNYNGGVDRILATGGGKTYDFTSNTIGYRHIYSKSSLITAANTLSWTQTAHTYIYGTGFRIEAGCTSFTAGTCPLSGTATHFDALKTATTSTSVTLNTYVSHSSYPTIPVGYKCDFPMTCPSGQVIKVAMSSGLSGYSNNPNAPTFKSSTGVAVPYKGESVLVIFFQSATMTWETKQWNVSSYMYQNGFSLTASCIYAAAAKCLVSPQATLAGTTKALTSTTLQSNTAIPLTQSTAYFYSDKDGAATSSSNRIQSNDAEQECGFTVSCPSGFKVMMNVSGYFVRNNGKLDRILATGGDGKKYDFSIGGVPGGGSGEAKDRRFDLQSNTYRRFYSEASLITTSNTLSWTQTANYYRYGYGYTVDTGCTSFTAGTCPLSGTATHFDALKTASTTSTAVTLSTYVNSAYSPAIPVGYKCDFPISCPTGKIIKLVMGAGLSGYAANPNAPTFKSSAGVAIPYKGEAVLELTQSATMTWETKQWNVSSHMYQRGFTLTASCLTPGSTACDASKDSGSAGQTISLTGTTVKADTAIPQTTDVQTFASDGDGTPSTKRISSSESGQKCAFTVKCATGYYVMLNVSGRFVNYNGGVDRILATGGGKTYDFSSNTNGYRRLYSKASLITAANTLSWTQSAHYYSNYAYGYEVAASCTSFVAGTCPLTGSATHFNALKTATTSTSVTLNTYVTSSSYPTIPVGYKCDFPMTCPTGKNIKLVMSSGLSGYSDNPNAPTFKSSAGVDIPYNGESVIELTQSATMTWETKQWNVSSWVYQAGFSLTASCVTPGSGTCLVSRQKNLVGSTQTISTSSGIKSNTLMRMLNNYYTYYSDYDGPSSSNRLSSSQSGDKCPFTVSCPSGYYVMLNVSGRFVNYNGGRDQIQATSSNGVTKYDFSFPTASTYRSTYSEPSIVTNMRTLSWTQSAHYYRYGYGYRVEASCTTFRVGTCPWSGASTHFASLKTSTNTVNLNRWISSSNAPTIPVGFKCAYPIQCAANHNIQLTLGSGIYSQSGNPNLPTFKDNLGNPISYSTSSSTLKLNKQSVTMTWEPKMWNVTSSTYQRGFNVGVYCVSNAIAVGAPVVTGVAVATEVTNAPGESPETGASATSSKVTVTLVTTFTMVPKAGSNKDTVLQNIATELGIDVTEIEEVAGSGNSSEVSFKFVGSKAATSTASLTAITADPAQVSGLGIGQMSYAAAYVPVPTPAPPEVSTGPSGAVVGVVITLCVLLVLGAMGGIAFGMQQQAKTGVARHAIAEPMMPQGPVADAPAANPWAQPAPAGGAFGLAALSQPQGAHPSPLHDQSADTELL